SEEPTANGTTGTPCAWQAASTAETSAVDSGNATASGRQGGNDDSSRPCRSSCDSDVESRSPRMPASASWSAVLGGMAGRVAAHAAGCGGDGGRARHRPRAGPGVCRTRDGGGGLWDGGGSAGVGRGGRGGG